MSGSVFELLDLIARWVHVIAGIMWIGNSMLFNWLDRSLIAESDPNRPNAPLGTIWLLHSGGFYYVEKTLLPGQRLPIPLHWFKWQAYTTWLSGVALLIVVYYVGGRALLVDPAKASLSPTAALLVAVGSIVLGWFVYDLLWRFVGEGILPPLLHDDGLTRWTPNGTAGALIGIGDHPLAPWAAALLLSGYAAAICGLAAVLFLRLDPT